MDTARAARYFMARVVRHLTAEAGVRQFLDVGTGLPAVDNTHEIAQRVAPECRIVYVDNDPLVLLPPGVVAIPDWRPDPAPFPPVHVDTLGGVGRKPAFH